MWNRESRLPDVLSMETAKLDLHNTSDSGDTSVSEVIQIKFSTDALEDYPVHDIEIRNNSLAAASIPAQQAGGGPEHERQRDSAGNRRGGSGWWQCQTNIRWDWEGARSDPGSPEEEEEEEEEGEEGVEQHGQVEEKVRVPAEDGPEDVGRGEEAVLERVGRPSQSARAEADGVEGGAVPRAERRGLQVVEAEGELGDCGAGAVHRRSRQYLDRSDGGAKRPQFP